MIVNFWFIRHLYISCVASTGSLFVEPCIVLAATSTHSLGCPDGPQSSNRSSSSLEQVSVLSLQQYICIRYAYNTPPHATPTGPNVRPKTCKTLPRFSGSRHKLLCCFPTNWQCPTYHDKTNTAETSAEHRDEATARTALALRRLDPAAKVGNVTWSVVVLGEGQLSKCLSPKPLNQWLENVSPLAKAQLPVPSWLSAASLFVLYKKNRTKVNVCFPTPHQQRNVLIPKLGQGILAVSAPRELCTKRRVTIAQTLSLAISLWETSLSQEPMVQCLHQGWEAVWKHWWKATESTHGE